MANGKCLCGAIEFEVELIPEKTFNCHCSRCRRSHGSAFATQVFAKGDTFKFIKGEDKISEFKDRPGVRAFCSECGSRLMNYLPRKSRYLSIALSCLDGDVGARPVANVYVGSKASWYAPTDDIPAFDELPEGAFK